MSNLLQYTLGFKDQFSAVYNRFIGSQRGVNQAANQLQRDTLNASRALRQMGASTNSLNQQLDKLRAQRSFIRSGDINTIRQYNREIALLERQIQRVESPGRKGISGMFGDLVDSTPFGRLLTNPLVYAGAAAGKSLSLGIQQDLQNTSFEVLLNSKESAKNLIGDITKYGMETSYDKMGLGENAKTLLSFNISAEKIMPTLKAIGDIAMGDAQKMSSLTLAFAQMSSVGKLQGQDLLQMINAGFNPLNEISKATGKSYAQLREEMEKGKISAQMVEKAFMSATSEGGQFYKMAELQGQTLGGKWAQFQDLVNEKLLNLYGILGPLASKGLELVSIFIEMTTNGIGKFFKALQEGNPWVVGITGALAAYTIGMTAALGVTKAKATWDAIATGTLWAQVSSWWALNSAMYANPVGLIIAGIVALAALMGYMTYKTDGWGEAWTHTVNGAKLIWKAYVGQVKAQFDTLVSGFMIGINKIQLAWYKFKNAIGLGDSSQNNAMISQLNQSISDHQEKIKKGWKEAGGNFKQGLEEFKQAGNSLSWNSEKSLGDLISGLKSKLGFGEIEEPKAGVGTGKVSTMANSDSAKKIAKKNETLATGGTRSTNVTINLGNGLIGHLTIQGRDFADSARQLETKTTDALLRVLAMATTAGS